MTLATLMAAIGRSKPVEPAPATFLLNALHDLDIEPFDRALVEQYKLQALEQAFPQALQHLEEAVRKAIQREPVWCEVTVPSTFSPDIADPAGIFHYIALTIASARQQGWQMRMYQDMHRFIAPQLVLARWRRMLCAIYQAEKGSMPEFVERKASQVIAQVPDIGLTMEVDALETNVIDCDPFLVAKLKDEEYYIEVWGGDDTAFRR